MALLRREYQWAILLLDLLNSIGCLRQHGGIGPMQGQANHFNFAAPEKMYASPSPISLPAPTLTFPSVLLPSRCC